MQKLDVLANQALLHCLGNRGNVAIMASEENEEPVVVERDRKHGKYVVVFDPLDGSSNIDVNVSVGTIFSILRRDPDPDGDREPLADVLQPGTQQVAAGYVVYGSSTMLVYTTGNGVHGFTLDPSIGAYLHQPPEHHDAERGSDLLGQRGQRRQLSRAAISDYLRHLRAGGTGATYSSRYIGSLVADFHRTLLKGGHLPLPADASSTPTASCGCCTRPTRSPSWPSRPAAWPPTARGRILDIQPDRCTSARRWSSAAATRWKHS